MKVSLVLEENMQMRIMVASRKLRATSSFLKSQLYGQHESVTPIKANKKKKKIYILEGGLAGTTRVVNERQKLFVVQDEDQTFGTVRRSLAGM